MEESEVKINSRAPNEDTTQDGVEQNAGSTESLEKGGTHVECPCDTRDDCSARDEYTKGLDPRIHRGSMVYVLPRTSPGFNDAGGVARVIMVHYETKDVEGESIMVGVSVDVKLVLGGVQRRVSPGRVSLHDVFQSKKERANKATRGRCARPDCKSFVRDCGHDQDRSRWIYCARPGCGRIAEWNNGDFSSTCGHKQDPATWIKCCRWPYCKSLARDCFRHDQNPDNWVRCIVPGCNRWADDCKNCQDCYSTYAASHISDRILPIASSSHEGTDENNHRHRRLLQRKRQRKKKKKKKKKKVSSRGEEPCESDAGSGGGSGDGGDKGNSHGRGQGPTNNAAKTTAIRARDAQRGTSGENISGIDYQYGLLPSVDVGAAVERRSSRAGDRRVLEDSSSSSEDGVVVGNSAGDVIEKLRSLVESEGFLLAASSPGRLSAREQAALRGYMPSAFSVISDPRRFGDDDGDNDEKQESGDSICKHLNLQQQQGVDKLDNLESNLGSTSRAHDKRSAINDDENFLQPEGEHAARSLPRDMVWLEHKNRESACGIVSGTQQLQHGGRGNDPSSTGDTEVCLGQESAESLGRRVDHICVWVEAISLPFVRQKLEDVRALHDFAIGENAPTRQGVATFAFATRIDCSAASTLPSPCNFFGRRREAASRARQLCRCLVGYTKEKIRREALDVADDCYRRLEEKLKNKRRGAAKGAKLLERLFLLLSRLSEGMEGLVKEIKEVSKVLPWSEDQRRKRNRDKHAMSAFTSSSAAVTTSSSSEIESEYASSWQEDSSEEEQVLVDDYVDVNIPRFTVHNQEATQLLNRHRFQVARCLPRSSKAADGKRRLDRNNNWLYHDAKKRVSGGKRMVPIGQHADIDESDNFDNVDENVPLGVAVAEQMKHVHHNATRVSQSRSAKTRNKGVRNRSTTEIQRGIVCATITSPFRVGTSRESAIRMPENLVDMDASDGQGHGDEVRARTSGSNIFCQETAA